MSLRSYSVPLTAFTLLASLGMSLFAPTLLASEPTGKAAIEMAAVVELADNEPADTSLADTSAEQMPEANPDVVELPSEAEQIETSVDARALIAEMVDHLRSDTSIAEMEMHIQRPTWQRTSRLKAWTRGREDALMVFTQPSRDAGNATLKLDEQMWTFTPKLNRTIRLPQSLMSQSWSGSDFSYNDLARSDDLLKQYDLSIVETRKQDGLKIYTIVAVPHDDAPVVWGKEQIELREDAVLLRQTFFDQDFIPVKILETLEIGDLSGRIFGTRMRMHMVEKPDEYTELRYLSANFDADLPDRTFTQFALKSGGPES